MNTENIIDLLMFRQSAPEDSSSTQPKITTGSIVWGAILRTAIIMVLSLLIIEFFDLYKFWWVSLFSIWLLAAWPAWRQFNSFSERIKTFTEETLCGTCRHFDPSGQLCKPYDEHVSTDYIPCEGRDWEPIHKNIIN